MSGMFPDVVNALDFTSAGSSLMLFSIFLRIKPYHLSYRLFLCFLCIVLQFRSLPFSVSLSNSYSLPPTELYRLSIL